MRTAPTTQEGRSRDYHVVAETTERRTLGIALSDVKPGHIGQLTPGFGRAGEGEKQEMPLCRGPPIDLF